MEAHASELYKLLKLNDTTFTIPVYQRNYEWDKANCKQFFYDIENIARTGKKHFIGSVTYVSIGTAINPYYIIVDGQQRITTAILFIKAIIDSTDDQKLKNNTFYAFLVNNDYNSGPKLKLKQIEEDSTIFEKLVFQKEFDERDFTETEKESHIYTNYMLFKELILQSDIQLEKLLEAFYGLQFIDVCLDGNDEDAQAIFESMNSTGKSLTSSDLIRNFLLMNLMHDTQELFYKNYWLAIEKNVGKKNVEQFFLDYIIMSRKNNRIYINTKQSQITSKNLYDVFKLHIKNRSTENIQNLLRDMRYYSSACGILLYENKRESKIEKKSYELFHELNCNSAIIFVMYLYDKYYRKELTEEEFENAIQACITFVMRSRMINGKATAQFFSLCIQNYEKADGTPIERVWKALSAGRGSYRLPDDAEFKNALCTKNLYLDYKQQFLRYILYKFERYYTKEVVEPDGATIEHILPQNPEKWLDDLKGDTKYQDYIHKLGNLTLTKYNSDLSNKSFEEKKKTDEKEKFDVKKGSYKESNYFITRELCNYARWDSITIKTRSETLANEALKIWAIPNIPKQEDVDILENMSNETRDLYESIHKSMLEIYPSMIVDTKKNYINFVDNGKIMFSLIPLSDQLKIMLRDKPLKIKDYEDMTEKGTATPGKYRISIKSEDDIYTLVNEFQNNI